MRVATRIEGPTANGLIDERDRRLIELTQAGLPLVSRPYHALARELGTDAEEVMRRFRRMQDLGIIRRIGAVPNHYALGYKANAMSVWDIDDEAIDSLGRRVGGLSFVSHCYRRPRIPGVWPYNLFVMVHGHDRDEVRELVRRLAGMVAADCRGHELLYSTRILKKTGLRLASGGGRDHKHT